MRRLKYSARRHYALVGAAAIAGVWIGAAAALLAAWCRICHHAEQAELAT